MNRTMHGNRGLALMAGMLCTLGLVIAGCSSDPEGKPSGSGGHGGSAGGNGGAGGGLPSLGAIVGMPLATFDMGTESFQFSNYVPNGETNLFISSPLTTTLAWDGTEGSPTPGSLKVTAPFTDWGQWVEVQAAALVAPSPYKNFTGKKLHVRLKVASGFGSDPYALGGAQALVNTYPGYVQVNAPKTVALGTAWQEFVVDVSTATLPGFDATMVINYGLHIYSGQGNGTAAKPTSAVFYIDSFSIE